MLATGDYPEWYPEEAKIETPNRGRFCGKNFKEWVSQIAEPKFRRCLPDSYVKNWIMSPQSKALDRIEFTNGSVINFMSYQQEADAFESWTGHWAKFDEPPQRALYVATIRGLAAMAGRVSLTLTPLAEPWIYQLVDSCKDLKKFGSKTFWEGTRAISLGRKASYPVTVRVVHAITDDNLKQPNWRGKVTGGMDEAGLAAFVASLTPEEIEVRRYGKFVHLQGLVFKEFNEKTHIIADDMIPAKGTMFQVLDPADSKPHAVAWYKVDPMNRCYCVYDEAIDGNLDQLANRIKDVEAEKKFEVDFRILDPNKGKTPTSVTRCTWQEELAQRGLYMNAEVNDDIALGHQKVRGMMAYDTAKPIDETNQPRLYFAQLGAKNTIFSIKNYIYDEHRNKDAHDGHKDKPRDKYKDFPDCLRYFCMSSPEYFNVSQIPTNLYDSNNFSTSSKRGHNG
jgi:phage terminase large subunit-like protein